MTSSYSDFAQRDPEALALVERLPELKNDSGAYRDAMTEIGKHLATAVLKSIQYSIPPGHLCVVCTVEDADFLAGGLIHELELNGLAEKIRLICLWNERVKGVDVAISPIVKQYKEEFAKSGSVFVIVKSIISGACVVKTNLARMLSMAQPDSIYVAAPVIRKGAEKRLMDEFPEAIGSAFKFIYFAEHDKVDENKNVYPGIGGSVYELLGFTESTKNLYIPSIVKERRRKHFAMGPA